MPLHSNFDRSCANAKPFIKVDHIWGPRFRENSQWKIRTDFRGAHTRLSLKKMASSSWTSVMLIAVSMCPPSNSYGYLTSIIWKSISAYFPRKTSFNYVRCYHRLTRDSPHHILAFKATFQKGHMLLWNRGVFIEWHCPPHLWRPCMLFWRCVHYSFTGSQRFRRVRFMSYELDLLCLRPMRYPTHGN